MGCASAFRPPRDGEPDRPQRDLTGLGRPGSVAFDLGRVEAMDTGEAWLIADLKAPARGRGRRLPGRECQRAPALAPLDTVTRDLPSEPAARTKRHGFVYWLGGNVGRTTVGIWRSTLPARFSGSRSPGWSACWRDLAPSRDLDHPSHAGGRPERGADRGADGLPDQRRPFSPSGARPSSGSAVRGGHLHRRF